MPEEINSRQKKNTGVTKERKKDAEFCFVFFSIRSYNELNRKNRTK